MPHEVQALAGLLTNGVNGVLAVRGYSPSRSERLNEVWEMQCDDQNVCKDWRLKFKGGNEMGTKFMAMWIPESSIPQECN